MTQFPTEPGIPPQKPPKPDGAFILNPEGTLHLDETGRARVHDLDADPCCEEGELGLCCENDGQGPCTDDVTRAWCDQRPDSTWHSYSLFPFRCDEYGCPPRECSACLVGSLPGALRVTISGFADRCDCVYFRTKWMDPSLNGVWYAFPDPQYPCYYRMDTSAMFHRDYWPYSADCEGPFDHLDAGPLVNWTFVYFQSSVGRAGLRVLTYTRTGDYEWTTGASIFPDENCGAHSAVLFNSAGLRCSGTTNILGGGRMTVEPIL